MKNVIRSLTLLVSVACVWTFSDCRSRYHFKGGSGDGASDSQNASTTGGNSGGTTTGNGPVVGITATQKNVVVKVIATSSLVIFRPSPATKGFDQSDCEFPDVVDAVWTIAGQQVAHLTRKDLGDCADLSYQDTYTKNDTLIVQLDIKTSGGQSGTATSTYQVSDDPTINGGGGTGGDSTSGGSTGGSGGTDGKGTTDGKTSGTTGGGTSAGTSGGTTGSSGSGTTGSGSGGTTNDPNQSPVQKNLK